MTDLGSLAAGSGGGTAEARAINPRGDVVGISETDPDIQDQAVLWSKGEISLLPNFGGHDNAANAINARGQIVGFADVAELQHHGVVWEHGVLKDLHPPTGAEGLRSEALDINQRGQIVGIFEVAPGEGRAVLWQDGKVIFVGPGPNSYARAINASGQILGAIDQHAVLWTKR
jgi:probable HAF family extracellular repeat protein